MADQFADESTNDERDLQTTENYDFYLSGSNKRVKGAFCDWLALQVLGVFEPVSLDCFAVCAVCLVPGLDGRCRMIGLLLCATFRLSSSFAAAPGGPAAGGNGSAADIFGCLIQVGRRGYASATLNWGN